MRRRKFISACCAGILTAPFGANAQPSHPPIVAMFYPASADVAPPNIGAFRARLAELGLIDGRDYKLVVRYVPTPSDEEYVRVATELLALSPAVVFAGNSTRTFRRLSATVPIVGLLGDDPVASGYAASLARPGGNTTGVAATFGAAILSKQLGLLKTMLPMATRIDALLEADDPLTPLSLPEVARKLNLSIHTSVVSRREELAAAIGGASGHADALYVGTGPFFNSNRAEIVALAANARLPDMYVEREAVVAGGLMSYGPSLPKAYALCADYVAKILGGARPADLPIEQPRYYDLVINSKTAKVLGITVPPTLLALADDVIE